MTRSFIGRPLTSPHPARLRLATLFPEGRGDPTETSVLSSPRPSGERVPCEAGRVRGSRSLTHLGFPRIPQRFFRGAEKGAGLVFALQLLELGPGIGHDPGAGLYV